MTSDLPDRAEPSIDEDVPRAPGGADADENRSDVGAASNGLQPVTPEPPLPPGARAEVPGEVLTPDEPDTSEDTDASEPSA